MRSAKMVVSVIRYPKSLRPQPGSGAANQSRVGFMSNSKTVSVIISCFNEEKTIEHCVQSVASAMPEAEIVVVHGGNDRTFEVARSLATEIPKVMPVRQRERPGQRPRHQDGDCQTPPGDVMAQFDADLQFFATDLPALVQPLLAGEVNVCLGSRFLPASNRAAYKPSWFRDCGNRVLAGYISLLSGRKVTDVTAGVKAWTRAAIAAIDFRDDRYTYEAEIVLHRPAGTADEGDSGILCQPPRGTVHAHQYLRRDSRRDGHPAEVL